MLILRARKWVSAGSAYLEALSLKVHGEGFAELEVDSFGLVLADGVFSLPQPASNNLGFARLIGTRARARPFHGCIFSLDEPDLVVRRLEEHDVSVVLPARLDLRLTFESFRMTFERYSLSVLHKHAS